MQRDLAFILPSRNEMFLKNTVEDLIKNKRGNTEIIVGLDGEPANPPLQPHPDVSVIYYPKSIGQRAMANRCVSLSQAKYVCKLDGHCSIDEGMDVKMLDFFKEVGDNVTAVPTMRNLWVFSWKCQKCGKKWYQGPTPTKCEETNFKGTGKPCESTKFTRKILWIAKERPQSNSFCFDSTPHFQYNNEYLKRPEIREFAAKNGYNETMSLQGSAFMLTREKYWELNICGEELGNWGGQGIEVACKTWLSGGRVLVNRATWYSHLFRTSGGDFGFPYSLGGRDTQRTKDNVKNLFWNKKYPKQIYPVSWLVEKFWPIPPKPSNKDGKGGHPGWTEEALTRLKEHESKL